MEMAHVWIIGGGTTTLGRDDHGERQRERERERERRRVEIKKMLNVKTCWH